MQDDTKVQKVPFILFIKTKIICSWILSIVFAKEQKDLRQFPNLAYKLQKYVS